MAPHLTLVPKGSLLSLPHASQEERFPGKSKDVEKAPGDPHDRVLEVLQHTAPLSEQQVRAGELLQLIRAAKKGVV